MLNNRKELGIKGALKLGDRPYIALAAITRLACRAAEYAINQFLARSIGHCSDAARCQSDYSRSIGFVRQTGQRYNSHMPCEAAGKCGTGYWTNLLVSRPLHPNALCGTSE